MTQPAYWREAETEAARVFEDVQYAARWLQSPNLALGGVIPRDLLDSEGGWQQVKSALAAVEFGHPL